MKEYNIYDENRKDMACVPDVMRNQELKEIIRSKHKDRNKFVEIVPVVRSNECKHPVNVNQQEIKMWQRQEWPNDR